MRLKQIKLAGFKSFVDATKIPFLNPLTAIIGPNGCGKSNVIDAVRWVLGESSAKNLRGDSWTDVIFNGANGRKPVSVASVELVFDNGEGRIGGQYANYNEIAVKRQVSRDGDNQYFLNGQKCRKKDITDIFMGTGLGPRSYAIIGQGTISRLIECKPQELRVFIEEAAGISRYKERRRDTENRIRHTRENLDRLGDIRAELGKQLEKLTLQAEAARRFRELKQQERQLTAELAVMRYLALKQRADVDNSEITRLETQLAKAQTEAERLALQLTQLKLQQNDLEDSESRQVALFYQANTDIAKIEQQISFLQERDQSLAKEQARLTEQLQQTQTAKTTAQSQYSALASQLDTLTPLQQQADEIYAELLAKQPEVDEQLDAIAAEFNQAKASASNAKHQQELAASNEQHLKQQLGREQQQLAHLQAKQQQQAPVQQESAMLKKQLQQHHTALADLKQQLHIASEQLKTQTIAEQQAKATRDELNQQLNQQQQRQQLLTDWLAAQQSNDTEDTTKLWQQIEIAAGWETAVEYWLKPLLAQQWFSDENPNLQGFIARPQHEWGPIKAPANLAPWLANWSFAADEHTALQMLPELASEQLVLCQSGQLLGQGIRLAIDASSDSSLLKMRAELQQLATELPSLTQQLADSDAALSAANSVLTSQQAAVTAVNQQLQQTQIALSTTEVALSAAERREQDAAIAQSQLTQDIEQQQQRISACEQQLESLIEAQFSQDDTLYEQQRNVQRLEATYQTAQQQRQTFKSQLLDAERKNRELTKQLTEVNTQHALVKQQCEQLSQQHQALTMRLAQLMPNELLGGETAQVSQLQQQLQQQLVSQQQQQKHLEQTRAQQTALQNQYDAIAIKQKQQLGEAEHLTQSISTLKLRREGLKGQAESQLKLLQEQQLQVENIAEQLPAECDVEVWQQKIESLRQKIGRLGAINLAAIEEFELQQQRKAYLDEQDNDLNQALASLEEAIRKIDRETRARFKATFDQVNQGLGELFPKVFGGGNAYLALTDDDLLDTGVTIMARPPGKKNSTIHLLSGGEKALTALSLVFAIFRLNPAPFCMLDEVDAPLDDANVDRFCRLLQEMSGSVQFIYISHNKITMEMADQLIGVTMHEPGVSRIVAVNIEEAVAMADAG